MSEGMVDVHGDAEWAPGLAVRGGHLAIKGNAGDKAGGSIIETLQYGQSYRLICMKGEKIDIEGDAGRETGDNMKGGEIHVNGRIRSRGKNIEGRLFNRGRLIAGR